MANVKNIFKFIGVGIGILITALAILYFFFGRGPAAIDPVWGVSFDPEYAESLGLDWQEAYRAVLDELGADHLRLSALWNQVEPERDRLDFSQLDAMLAAAEEQGARVTLAIGRRLPRWPECHIPDWALSLPETEQQAEILALLPEIVNRYKSHPALEFWQVENEPYAWFFGECPEVDPDFLAREMALVRDLDPEHPVLVTGSGELSSWFRESRFADLLGISVYRVTYEARLLRVYQNYSYLIPPHFYRIKANLVRQLGWFDEIWVSELQAEPWGPQPLAEMPLAEQYRSFNPKQFRSNLEFARATGFERFYLWGAEWWFYAREKHGVEEFVEIAKELWR